MPKAKKKEESSDEEAEEYDWNVKARCIDVLHEERKSAPDAKLTIEWPDDDIPDGSEPLSPSKVKKFKLNHGDVLRFDDYRFCQSFIVNRTWKGDYKLIENPDDSGSAELTIPAEVLRYVSDAMAKYEDLLSGSCIILHVSHRDQFVVDQLGEDIPDSWDITVEFNWGSRENVFITQGDRTWESNDWDDATLEDIEKFFAGADVPNTKLVVKIDLKGDKFQEYKTKHCAGKKSLAWVKAFANLPKTWSVEKGGCGMGSTHYRTEWRCMGPTEEKDKVKKLVEEFFEGFEFCVEEEGA